MTQCRAPRSLIALFVLPLLVACGGNDSEAKGGTGASAGSTSGGSAGATAGGSGGRNAGGSAGSSSGGSGATSSGGTGAASSGGSSASGGIGSCGLNEPADFMQIHDRHFQSMTFTEGGIAEGWWHHYFFDGERGGLVTEATPSGDNQAIRLRLGAGEDGETGDFPQLGYVIPPGSRPRDIYACVWVKVDATYKHHYLGQKFLYFYDESGPHTLYTYAGISPVSMGGDPTGVSQWFIAGQVVTDIPEPISNVNVMPNLASVSVQNGQWALVEQVIYNQTSPGSSDGEWHVWINGKKTIEITNIPFTGASGSRRWDAISPTPTYGGGIDPYGPVPEHQYIYLDRVYISGRTFF